MAVQVGRILTKKDAQIAFTTFSNVRHTDVRFLEMQFKTEHAGITVVWTKTNRLDARDVSRKLETIDVIYESLLTHQEETFRFDDFQQAYSIK